MVVSELANGNAKTTTPSNIRKARRAATGLCALQIALLSSIITLLPINTSFAAIEAGQNIIVEDGTTTDDQKISTSPDPKFTSVTTDTLTAGTVTLGTGTNEIVLKDGVIQVGSAGSISVGGKTYVSNSGLNANNQKITNVADGALTNTSTDAVNGKQLNAVKTTAEQGFNVVVGSNSTKIGPGNNLTFTAGTNLTVTNTAGTINVGLSATPTFTSVTIDGGISLSATGLNNGGQKITNVATATAGTDAVNKAQMDTAIQNLQTGNTSLKYFKANSSGTNDDAVASGTDAVAIGKLAEGIGDNSLAMGKEASANGTSAVAIGDGTITEGDNTIAIGKSSKAVEADAIAIGQNAEALDEGAIALGKDADAKYKNGIAIGTGTVTAENALAMGTNANATNNSVALGNQAISNASNSVALGTNTASTGTSSISIGDQARSSGQRDIALGTGAGTGSQAGDPPTLMHDRIAIGTDAGQNNSGNESIAMGYKAGNNVTGSGNIAIGSLAGSNVTGEFNTSIGYSSNTGNSTIGSHSTAIGAFTKASAGATAVGDSAKASGENSVALGYGAQATAGTSIAIGQNAKSTDNSIALGDASFANQSISIGTGYLTGSAANSSGVVSVGSDIIKRRIVNVADGSAGNDAVNVNQLKASQANIAKLIGGGVTIDTTTGGYTKFKLLKKDGNPAVPADYIEFDSVSAALGAISANEINVALTDAVKYTDSTKTNIDANATLSNVKDATTNDQAVNLGQMNEAVEDSRVKYYSVNSDISANRNNAGADGLNSMALGPAAKAIGAQSISIGLNTKSEGRNSIVIGNAESPTDTKQAVAYNESGIAIGTAASSKGQHSIAFGYYAETQGKDADLTSDDAIAFGTRAKVTADSGVALGTDAVASGINAFAQGTRSNATATSSISVGTDSKVSGTNSLAVGSKNNVSGVSSGAIGTTMTGGTGDANNVLGNNTYVVGNANGAIAATNSSIIGNQNKLGDSFINTKGESEAIFANNSSVLGNNNTVTAIDSSVIGYNNILGKKPANGSNDYDFANKSGVMGSNNTVTGNNNRIIGNNNNDHDQNSVFILGNNVGYTSDILANSVYLGDSAAYVATSTTTQGNQAYASIIDNGSTYTFAGGTTPAGIVSVGSVGEERRIQNLAAGLVTAGSTDAVNGSQLYALTRPLGFKGDTGIAIKRSSDQTLDIIGGATGTLTGNNIGVTNENDKLVVKLSENLTNINSIKFKSGTVELNTNGLNNGGNKITNVATGTAPTDAVNVSQLTEAASKATTTVTGDKNVSAIGTTKTDGHIDYQLSLNNKVELGSGVNQITVDGTAGTISAGTGTNKITFDGRSGQGNIGNVTINGGGISGTVNGLTNKTWNPDNFISGQAATEDQLKSLDTKVEGGLKFAGDDGQTITKKLGEQLNIVGGDTNLGEGNTAKNIKTLKNTKGELEIQLEDELEVNKITMGDVIVDKDGLFIGGRGPTNVYLTNEGLHNGGNKITGVAAGVENTDAVNVGQMKDYVGEEAAKSKATVSEGNGIKVDKTGPTEGPNDYKVSLKNNITLGEGNNAVNIDGENSKIQVGGADGISIDGKEGHIDGLKNTTWDPETTGKDTPSRAATEGQLQGLYQDVNTKIDEVNTKVDELDANSITGGKIGADGKITLKKKDSEPDITLEGQLHDYALDNNKGEGYTADTNGDVTMKVVDQYNTDNSYDVKIKDVASKKKLDDLTEAVGVGTKDEMKDKYKDTNFIKNADDMAGADIILDREVQTNRNMIEQQGDQINNLNNNVNRLGSRVDKVGAGAAALAALHPTDFDPDTKLSFAAGVGNYKGETAGSIGAFYRPNEKVMLSMGGTVGNGENMVNMGISFALDRTNRVNDSKVAMAKELVDLRKQVADLTVLVMQNNTKGYSNIDVNRLFPDVAENHWAYEYITSLAKQGIIEGYPDGNFAGDRLMTRYEFAALLYRAMQKGANVDSKLISEFEAELGRIRVDRIQGNDTDTDKIERVRVNTDKNRDHYGSEVAK